MKDDSTLPRDDDSKLITYAWPGGYPAYYVTEDGGVLCPECARMAEREDLSLVDENGGIDAQWHIVAADINWEDADLYCDHCYTRIESAYAEPEDG